MSIAFEIPARFATSEFYRIGTTMRSHATGQIVAHLQETTGLTRMAGLGFDPTSMVAGGIQIYQNEQIKVGLALVQNLQIANLALTGVGIGVSVAGFAILARKLDRIERSLAEITAAIQRLAKKVERIEARLIRVELAELRAELRRIDEAWMRSDAQAQWRIAADRLLTLEQAFGDHVRAADSGAGDASLRALMVDAFTLAGSSRISALLAANEADAAGFGARGFARSLAGFTGNIGAPQILREMQMAETAPADPAARLAAIARLRPQAEAGATLVREREDSAATAPITIAALTRAGVSGREWLERARSEAEAPLICLPVDDEGAADSVAA